MFDLDPGAEVPWSRVLDAARLLRSELERLGLESWVKLTGGKGLHVVLPFRPDHEWPAVYAFSRSVAELMVQRDPEAFSLDFAKSGREKKILVDYKRNHRAAVAISAYNTRANPSAALSVPVAWSELNEALSPQPFTVQNMAARLKKTRNLDPWREYWTCRQRLKR